jgi:hypothetical protein
MTIAEQIAEQEALIVKRQIGPDPECNLKTLNQQITDLKTLLAQKKKDRFVDGTFFQGVTVFIRFDPRGNVPYLWTKDTAVISAMTFTGVRSIAVDATTITLESGEVRIRETQSTPELTGLIDFRDTKGCIIDPASALLEIGKLTVQRDTLTATIEKQESDVEVLTTP